MGLEGRLGGTKSAAGRKRGGIDGMVDGKLVGRLVGGFGDPPVSPPWRRGRGRKGDVELELFEGVAKAWRGWTRRWRGLERKAVIESIVDEGRRWRMSSRSRRHRVDRG